MISEDQTTYPYTTAYESVYSSAIAKVEQRKYGRRGSRNYECLKCGKSYMVIKSLKRHLRYECGLAPRFKCPYCGMLAKQKAHIKEHVRRKHRGNRIYAIELLL